MFQSRLELELNKYEQAKQAEIDELRALNRLQQAEIAELTRQNDLLTSYKNQANTKNQELQEHCDSLTSLCDRLENDYQKLLNEQQAEIVKLENLNGKLIQDLASQRESLMILQDVVTSLETALIGIERTS